MRKTILFLAITSLLIACQEDTRVNAVKGQLFKDCQSLLPNVELAMKTNPGGTFQEAFIIGSGTTNNQGEFDFSYELKEEDRGSGDLILLQTNGFKTLISNLELNQDFQLLLFKENEARLEVSLSLNQPLSMNDTLFFGVEVGGLEKEIVQPNAGVLDTLKINIPNSLEGSISSRLFFGLGRLEFEQSKEALGISDSVFQHVPVQLSGCTAMDRAEIIIN